MRLHICLYKNNEEVLNINDVTTIQCFGNFIQVNQNFEKSEILNGYIFEDDEFDNFEVDKID